MINENKSSCYLEPETCKQGVCSPYNELAETISDINENKSNPNKDIKAIIKL